METIDIFAHARADGEVCSAAIIEALYHSKPVISHPSLNMGHVEQIEGCGKVVNTIQSYAEEMLAFEKNKEYRLKMSANAKKKYDIQYKYDTVINKIIDVYYEVKTSIAKK